MARVESDSLGEMTVPDDALYGAQTARAINNFQVSGRGIGREMIWALSLIKRVSAKVNFNLGLLTQEIAEPIQEAAKEVEEGIHDDQFPVDCFQTGSGTSSNMNMNEVIANRAIQLTGGILGSKTIHPNDHVNLGQSSNDVFPSAIHLSVRQQIESALKPALDRIYHLLLEKSEEFYPVVKIGRTHLQDAVPIRLGQEFSGFAGQIDHGIINITDSCKLIEELAVGGTAVGTGLNTHPEFGIRVAREIAEHCGIPFVETSNHFAAQAGQDGCVQMSGTLKTLAIGLMKIANDIRWLGSGPRLGLGELKLPVVQPGSSIMPGKVNPVIAESLIMVCAQVIGNDTAISLGGVGGNFQLNTMLPLIARNLLEQIHLLSRAINMFSEKLLKGLMVDHERIAALNMRSLSLATVLVPSFGYDRAAEIAKQAYENNKTIAEVVREEKLLTDSEFELLFDLKKQT